MAHFIGSPSINLIEGKLIHSESGPEPLRIQLPEALPQPHNQGMVWLYRAVGGGGPAAGDLTVLGSAEGRAPREDDGRHGSFTVHQLLS